MIQSENVRYIKLKNGDHIVAYTKDDNSDYIEIARPISLTFQYYSEDDEHQILKVKEWIPPLIAKFDTITIDKKEIFFILDVQDAFIKEYADLADIFFVNNIEEQDDINRKNAIKEHSNSSVVLLEDIWKSIKKH